MSTRSARSALFESKPASKRLVAAPRAWPRPRAATRLTGTASAALAVALCVALGACGNDDNKTPDTSTTSAEQINAAPPAPYAVPSASSQNAPSQNVSVQSAQAVLPAHAIQTPPPGSAQLGAAASDSLVTPVIHTVD